MNIEYTYEAHEVWERAVEALEGYYVEVTTEADLWPIPCFVIGPYLDDFLAGKLKAYHSVNDQPTDEVLILEPLSIHVY